MNRQREVIYSQRRQVLGGEDIPETISKNVNEMVEDIVASFCPEKTSAADWDWPRLLEEYLKQFAFVPELAGIDQQKVSREDLESYLKAQADAFLAAKREDFTPSVMDHLSRILLLQTIDARWKEHLLSIDHMKEGIGLRGYAQKNPKEEYKREAYGMFMEMMGRIGQDVVQKLFHVQLAREEDVEELEARQRRQQLALNRMGGGEPAGKSPKTREDDKVGRNDPCPCGSGKKYKRCCGS
jgi:preprotein translocase subunit SecA